MTNGDSSGFPPLPSRCTDRTVAVVDDVVDGRRRSVGRCRQFHGSSIRRCGRNFLPTYKWGFSEPCFGQRAGQKWCARRTRCQSDLADHIRSIGGSAGVSTGVEVVVSELHRAQVNVNPAQFSGKASNHQPDCDLHRLRPRGASASAGRFRRCLTAPTTHCRLTNTQVEGLPPGHFVTGCPPAKYARRL